ncbi:hypothetical protein G4B88_018207 [Cannabis sativa]|uniref:DUF4378 domain-containing protein n=1 Tax=Cannabis sativa TaxID=3483 RepID=A0A7J6G956_CANSA|nr:hypothetical protein G4B88_018207 [Cannabis sativa]
MAQLLPYFCYISEISSNLSELWRQLNQLESDAPDERLIPPKPAEPEISETSAKPIGTSVFEEVEESYKTFAKDNDISLKDQRLRRVDHKLLHDLLNEALSTVLEPHRGISTVSKVERKSMNSSSFPTLHGNKLLNCVWEIICDHLYPSTDRSCYSLEDMVAQDLRLSPWTREVDDEGTSLGREVKERTANANDFVNGGSHVMEYGSRSIRAEKLYLYQKLKLRNLTPTSVERLSLSLTDFFSGETTPEAVKFKIKGGSKPAGQHGLMGSSSSTAHENVSRVEFEEFKKCLSVVVSQQGILMKSVAEMNKKLDILIEPDQSQGGEENIDVDATIASAVKAVENLIGSSTHAPAPVETSEKTDLEMVVFQETPILRPQKRDRKNGAVLKSPFIELASGASKSGSSSVSPDDSVYKVVKYVRGLCPLDNKIGEPVDPQLEAEFVKWVDSGLRKHKSNTTTNVYCKGKDTIFSPFRFGVEDISNKMWFHNLAYPNCFLTNSHIDIIFYYLRKKIMYSAEPKIKVTTTDCLFCSSITTLYERFVEKNNDISVLSLSHNVAQYIQGEFKGLRNETKFSTMEPFPIVAVDGLPEQVTAFSVFLNPNIHFKISSNLSELRRQLNQLESDAPDERLIPPKPAEPEISETSAKPIGTSVFEEVEESYKTFAKDNDISLKDQRLRRVDHKLLHDLLNEALSTVLEPHRGISTVSKVERKSMNSSSFPTLHGNKLLNCVWEIICDHLYPSTDRSCYSLEDMVARDLRLSPWTREVDDEGTTLGREVKERTANANDFVNGGSHVMEYGSRSIRAEKLYLDQKLKLRNLTPTSVERLSLSLTDFFSGETTPEAVKFKIKGGSKPAGQHGLMGSSSSTAHENVSRVEFEEFKKCLSVVVSQQGILMKSVAEMNKKLDILIEPDQSQGGEENIDVDATIASAVKAVENLIGSSTHAPAPVETSEKTDLEMVVFQETPILRPQKRDRKNGAVLKSPFIELASGASKSGSSSVSPDDSVYKVVKYVRGLCPLDNKIGEPVDPQLEAEFVKWVDSGLRKHKSNTTTNVYCKGKDTIFPPFRFGVEDISNKMWFHNLAYPNCFLTNSHIDIIFYYLRKKIMYSAEPKIKVTTTDCLFCSSITTLYERFVEKNNDISVLSLSHNVAQYIQGDFKGLLNETKFSTMEPFPIVAVDGLPEQVTAFSLKLRNLTPTSVERLSLSLTDFFSGETTPEAVKFKIKGGSKPAGQHGLMGSSSSTAHENVSRVEFEEFKKCLSVVVSQQGILMKSVAEMNKKLDILIEPDQSQGGEENIDVDATIASAVKAVENLIGSSTHAPAPVETSEKTDLEMVVFQETPILRPQKRDRKNGAVLKSPFIELASGASKSGSSSVSPDDSVYKVVKYVRGLCPLDNKIGEPVDPQLEAEFVKWVDSGLRKHKSNTTTNVYCKGKDTIFPPFRFGVEDISNKMWFHNLAYPNCFLTNSHIDIIFYYLRKKIMYSAEPKIKVTTTDCLFCSSITTLYERFVEKNNDISVLSLSHNVAQYIQGDFKGLLNETKFSTMEPFPIVAVDGLPEQVTAFSISLDTTGQLYETQIASSSLEPGSTAAHLNTSM